MATIRLIPSEIYNGASSYVSISNASNAYYNTDHTSSYATIQNTYSSTSSRYVYVRGFNFDDIPSGVTINSFTIKVRGYESGLATSSSYAPTLANGTSTISNTTASANFGTSTKVITVPTGALTWTNITNYGSDFGIRLNVRRNSRNTASYIYLQGAEIEVDYTVPNPRTITSTLSGSGTISPSGATTSYDGEEYTLTITPTNISDTVTVTNNGVNVTSELEEHYSGGTATSYSTASGSGVTTGFARSGSQFYRGNSSTTGDNWLRYAIGYTAESPYSTSNTSNTYCKDGTNDATTQGWMNYPFNFSSLPADAEVTSVEVKCYGATESTTETARHADVSLWCGSTQKGTTQSFTSTSNGTITINDTGTWTREELQDAWVRFGVGYYGGRILGITWKVNYTYGGTLHHYTYTYNVNGNATIAVTIGGGSVVHVTGVSLDQHTASVQAGQTVQLTATVSPNNATDKSVSWSSNNTSVATVNSSGLVTAVSAGTATITVTTTDGSYTDTCVVTVTAAVTYDYKLAASTVVGKKYLIANGSTGTVYLLTNESGGSRQLVGMSVTVSNGRISLTAAQKALAEFECVRYTSGNDNTITMKSDNKYLYTDNSSGLRMNAPTTLDRFWHYRDNKFWQFKSTTSDGYEDTSTEYKYYLQMTGTNFTDNHVTSPSISETDIPAIYIFVEDDGTTEEIYVKQNGTWVQYSKVYKKINGAWIEQADISSVFSTDANYVKAN